MADNNDLKPVNARNLVSVSSRHTAEGVGVNQPSNRGLGVEDNPFEQPDPPPKPIFAATWQEASILNERRRAEIAQRAKVDHRDFLGALSKLLGPESD